MFAGKRLSRAVAEKLESARPMEITIRHGRATRPYPDYAECSTPTL